MLRPYSVDMAGRAGLELLVFGDASEAAFTALAYFRITRQDGSVILVSDEQDSGGPAEAGFNPVT